MQASNENLKEERAIINTFICCQTCALQLDYFQSKSENDMGTKWELTVLNSTSLKKKNWKEDILLIEVILYATLT